MHTYCKSNPPHVQCHSTCTNNFLPDLKMSFELYNSSIGHSRTLPSVIKDLHKGTPFSCACFFVTVTQAALERMQFLFGSSHSVRILGRVTQNVMGKFSPKPAGACKKIVLFENMPVEYKRTSVYVLVGVPAECFCISSPVAESPWRLQIIT